MNSFFNRMAKGSSSRKRNRGGGGRSGNRKRKNTRIIDKRNGDVDVEVKQSESSDDDVFNKINVKTPTGKIISFKVKSSDTIGSVKVKIQAKEGIPFDKQELIFDQMVLQDMDIFANLRIKNESTLTLMLKLTGFINICIKDLDGHIAGSLQVKPYDTIGAIKEKITCDERDALIFNENVLDDEGTHSHFNIVSGSTLTVIYKSEAYMEVFVKSFTGKTFSLEFSPMFTIFDLKLGIMEYEDVPHEEQVLIFNNMVLGDDGTLLDFNITKKSTLTLLHRPREFTGFMQIFIKPLTGETITLEVKPEDTIGDVKAMIQDKVGVPCEEQELIFNEMVIHDVHALGDFLITNNSTLTLIRISTGFMRIFIEMYDGKLVTLKVKSSNTISDVKSKIHKRGHIPPSWQRLIFSGKQLEDSATLAHYHIPNESTILCLL